MNFRLRTAELRRPPSAQAFDQLQGELQQVLVKIKGISSLEERRDLLRELRLLLVEFDLQLLELPD
jgi:hypothetical protein